MKRKWNVFGTTSRQADLYGKWSSAGTTDLKTLRQFVEQLEGWPGNARVKTSSGMVLRVVHWSPADPFGAKSDSGEEEEN